MYYYLDEKQITEAEARAMRDKSRLSYSDSPISFSPIKKLLKKKKVKKYGTA